MSFNAAPQEIVLLGTANNDGTFTGVTSGMSKPINPGQHESFAIALIGDGTISGGTVLIEEAAYTKSQYNGTWSQISSTTASDITGNAQKVIHVAPNALMATRVRISSGITGGGGISAVARFV